MKENMFYAYSSYCPEAGLPTFTCFWCNKTTEKLRITKIFKHDPTTTLGYIGFNSRSIVISFRGSILDIDGWLNNLRLSKTIPYPAPISGSAAHDGFVSSYLYVQREIKEEVSRLWNSQIKHILVTGHSRGFIFFH
jgi:predicted lipase